MYVLIYKYVHISEWAILTRGTHQSRHHETVEPMWLYFHQISTLIHPLYQCNFQWLQISQVRFTAISLEYIYPNSMFDVKVNTIQFVWWLMVGIHSCMTRNQIGFHQSSLTGFSSVTYFERISSTTHMGDAMYISLIDFQRTCTETKTLRWFNNSTFKYYFLHQLWKYICHISTKMYKYCPL